MALVEERIAQGWSDEQIIDAFVASYGEWILLDPPIAPATALLWLIPAAGVAVGVLAAHAPAPGQLPRSRRGRRRRPRTRAAPGAVVTTTATGPWEQKIAQARADLAALERQVEDGELDEADAAPLRAAYLKEISDAEQAASDIGRITARRAGPEPPAPGGCARRGGGDGRSDRGCIPGAGSSLPHRTMSICPR